MLTIIVSHTEWILNYRFTRFFKVSFIPHFQSANHVKLSSFAYLSSELSLHPFLQSYHSTCLLFIHQLHLSVHTGLWDNIYIFMVSNLYFNQPCSLSSSIFYMYLRWVDAGIEKWHPGTRIKGRKTTKLNLNQKNYQTDISMTEKYCIVLWLDSSH